jgi:predicted CXXCH cytochrome family protein
MRKIMILALIALPAAFLAFTGIAMAGVAPHGGYGAGTDYCLSCHDVHDAAGDYALMREATVTETCATCHNLFGLAPDGTWTVAPPDMGGSGTTNATASVYSAYSYTGSAKKSGHDLGVSLNGEPSRNDDAIPGGSLSLRVMKSADYEEGDRYNNESVLDFDATAGLYCASCHTPHGIETGKDLVARDPATGNCTAGTDGKDDAPKTKAEGNFGRQLVAEQCGSTHPKDVPAAKLLSSMPNHAAAPVDSADPVGAYNAFCISCHDQRDDGNVGDAIHNHPPLCVSCHTYSANDFPHTQNKIALINTDNDSRCTGCHGHVGVEGYGPLP